MMSEQAGSGDPAFLSASPAPVTDGMAFTPPRWLRLMRLLSGVALLTVALGGGMVEVNLVTSLRGGIAYLAPSSPGVIPSVVFIGVASLWLLAVVLGCLLTGAMSLWIAITRSGW